MVVEGCIHPVGRMLGLRLGKIFWIGGTFTSKCADGLSAAIAIVQPRSMIPWSDLKIHSRLTIIGARSSESEKKTNRVVLRDEIGLNHPFEEVFLDKVEVLDRIGPEVDIESRSWVITGRKLTRCSNDFSAWVVREAPVLG